MSTDRLRLSIEVTPQLTPITGTLTGADGAMATFAGWAQLVRAIEQAAQVHLDDVESGDTCQQRPSDSRRSP